MIAPQATNDRARNIEQEMDELFAQVAAGEEEEEVEEPRYYGFGGGRTGSLDLNDLEDDNDADIDPAEKEKMDSFKSFLKEQNSSDRTRNRKRESVRVSPGSLRKSVQYTSPGRNRVAVDEKRKQVRQRMRRSVASPHSTPSSAPSSGRSNRGKAKVAAHDSSSASDPALMTPPLIDLDDDELKEVEADLEESTETTAEATTSTPPTAEQETSMTWARPSLKSSSYHRGSSRSLGASSHHKRREKREETREALRRRQKRVEDPTPRADKSPKRSSGSRRSDRSPRRGSGSGRSDRSPRRGSGSGGRSDRSPRRSSGSNRHTSSPRHAHDKRKVSPSSTGQIDNLTKF